MNRKRALIFLTACVNPNGMALTALQNPEMRLKHYLESVSFYLKNTAFDILLVENTGYDFTPHFHGYVKGGRMEILSFDGNNYNRELGKGYGEALIVDYAVKYSLFWKTHECIIKITGRHIVTNVKQIWNITSFLFCFKNKVISAAISPSEKVAFSEIFIASKFFYSMYFLPQKDKINDTCGIYFEHVLYETIQTAVSCDYLFFYIPFLIRQSGVSGSTGKNLQISYKWTDKMKPFIKCILYLCGLGWLSKAKL